MNQHLINIYRLAEYYGVQTSYINLAGEKIDATPDVLLLILNALGVKIDKIEDSYDALVTALRDINAQIVPPVLVVWGGGIFRVALNIPDKLMDTDFKATLTLEDCQCYVITNRFSLLESDYCYESDGQVFHRRSLFIDKELPFGYHWLMIEYDSNIVKTLIISAPLRSFRLDECREDLDKISSLGNRYRWGIFAPIYALHNQRTWGVGDINVAGELLRWSAKLGSQIYATLPLLPTYLNQPCHPSPYWPISRLFWNELFIDIEQLSEFKGCDYIKNYINSSGFRIEKNYLKNLEYIDYKRVAKLKRKVLEVCSKLFFENQPEIRESEILSEFDTELIDYARFRAVQDLTGKIWCEWDEALRKGLISDKDYNISDYRYHLYTQYVIKKQIEKLSADNNSVEQTLLLDLPVGVHPYGYDTWRFSEHFAFGVTVGAPPDPLAPQGQDWGFPPLHPDNIRKKGYDYFIKMIRHHLKVCGSLRIDHIMGLHRLFWVPNSMPASQGVYVLYKFEEFYAILCLESQRYCCEIIGEDLGTVPDEVRTKMDEHGFRRLYVLPFETNLDANNALHPVPEGAVASLNTHDIHPFTAFWTGYDIMDMAQNNIFIGDINIETEKREYLKRTLIEFLKSIFKSGCNDDELFSGEEIENSLNSVISTDLMYKYCIYYLAKSQAGVVLVNLEDLWGEIQPQNRPGLIDRRNWSHKFKLSLEEIVNNPDLLNLLKNVNKIRKMKGV